MYAIYYCILQCHGYLTGHKFIVETDHRNLVWLERATAPKLVRWRLRLQEFDYEVHHVPGNANIIADTLSRLPTVAAVGAATNTVDLHACYTDGKYEELVQRLHNATIGHYGRRHVLQLLRALGYEWPGHTAVVEQVLARCITCQRNAVAPPVLPSAHHIEATEPFQLVCVDTIGPLPEDEYGNRYVIVLIDAFSRFVELHAAASTTAVAAADALLGMFGRYGLPERILSDSGIQYVNAVIKLLLEFLGVVHTTSVPYRHQGNGVVERVNRETLRHLRHILEHENVVSRWGRHLPRVQYIINMHISDSTGFSPMQLLFGGRITDHRGLLYPFQHPVTEAPHDYVKRLDDSLRIVTDISRSYQEQRLSRATANAAPDPDFVLGALVLAQPGTPRSKLYSKWTGPYEVIAKRRRTYTLRHLATNKERVLDGSRLKAFVTSPGITPESVAARDLDLYIVDHIVEHTGNLRHPERCRFKVRWTDYGVDDDTWEPHSHVKDTDALETYLSHTRV